MNNKRKVREHAEPDFDLAQYDAEVEEYIEGQYIEHLIRTEKLERKTPPHPLVYIQWVMRVNTETNEVKYIVYRGRKQVHFGDSYEKSEKAFKKELAK